MVINIPLVCLIVLLAAIILSVYTRKCYHRTLEGVTPVFYVSSIGIFILWLILWSVTVSSIVSLENFYNTNSKNYNTVITQTEAMFSAAVNTTGSMIPVQGSIEKQQLGNAVSDRLKEYIVEVNKYNANLVSAKFWSKNPITGSIYPIIPNYLQPILIK